LLPGIGTRVANARAPTRADRQALLHKDVEAVVVEARRLQLDIDDLIDAIKARRAALDKDR
jgi:hypothetical protein